LSLHRFRRASGGQDGCVWSDQPPPPPLLLLLLLLQQNRVVPVAVELKRRKAWQRCRRERPMASCRAHTSSTQELPVSALAVGKRGFLLPVHPVR
ncbi:hypothetical protein EC988_005946, partial [Linderina pennispora]